MSRIFRAAKLKGFALSLKGPYWQMLTETQLMVTEDANLRTIKTGRLCNNVRCLWSHDGRHNYVVLGRVFARFIEFLTDDNKTTTLRYTGAHNVQLAHNDTNVCTVFL